MGFVAEAWPVLVAMVFLLILTLGALRPYMKRKDPDGVARKMPDKEPTDDRRETDD